MNTSVYTHAQPRPASADRDTASVPIRFAAGDATQARAVVAVGAIGVIVTALFAAGLVVLA